MKRHISRGWPGQQHIEEACPCPKERCGYVSDAKILAACDQHSWDAARTIRSGHLASDCPELPSVMSTAIGSAFEDFCWALDQIAQEHELDSKQMEGYVNGSIGEQPGYEEWMGETWEPVHEPSDAGSDS